MRAAPTNSRRRRPRNPEATRADLIEATLRVLRQGGIAAVTTVAVTREAGLAQSGFYSHFRNIDECLQAAAEEVSRQVRHFIAEDRRRIHETMPDDLTAQVMHYRSILEFFDEHRPLAEVLLRHRLDPTPVGQVMGRLIESIQEDMVNDSCQLAHSSGVSDEHHGRVVLMVELIVAQVLAAGQMLIEGRVDNRDMLAEELFLHVQAMVKDLLLRCSGS